MKGLYWNHEQATNKPAEKEDTMTMRANTDPRRIYTRAGQVLVCFEGKYFGASATKSSINPDKEVKCVPAGSRLKVTQGKSSETWSEQHLKVEHRAA